MGSEAAQLQALLAKDRICEAIARLARGEDRRDGDLIKAAYWPDAITDYGMFAGDFDAYFAWVIPGADAIKNTQHMIGQSVIDLDGDSAKAETQVISYHRVDMGAGDLDTCIGGRYLDIFEKRGEEWRIASRVMLYDWYQDWGQSIDWSQGVMGMPFSAEYFAGRAVGDHSEVFFGKRPG
ncbi:MAG: nuclear transport factor 2 family protein [Sphingobium sp.]